MQNTGVAKLESDFPVPEATPFQTTVPLGSLIVAHTDIVAASHFGRKLNITGEFDIDGENATTVSVVGVPGGNGGVATTVGGVVVVFIVTLGSSAIQENETTTKPVPMLPNLFTTVIWGIGHKDVRGTTEVCAVIPLAKMSTSKSALIVMLRLKFEQLPKPKKEW